MDNNDSLESFLFVALLYFVPWLVAHSRHHRDRAAIGILNALLGWTVFGWIAAAVWAFTGNVEEKRRT